MKKPKISEYKTFAMIQTNAPKIQYGSGIVGAGFRDVYQNFREVRGKFEQKFASRQLDAGTVGPVSTHRYTFRYSTEIMSIVDLELRLLIRNKVYTLVSYDVEIFGRAEVFVFNLSQYGK